MERDYGIKFAKVVAAGGIALGSLSMAPVSAEADVDNTINENYISAASNKNEVDPIVLAVPFTLGLLGFAAIIANSSRPNHLK
jgi:hypothetical protein